MRNNLRFTVLVGIMFILGAATGCQNAANTNAVVNTNTPVNQNTNRSVVNLNTSENRNAVTEVHVASLETPTDAYKAAYEIRQRKDVAGLKKVMSKDVLEFFTEVGKADGKSLDEVLKELIEKPQGPTNETRNEKITGDLAVLEYKNEKNEWREMDFIKEEGEWKMTIPSADGPGASGPTKSP